ncbi:MAG: thioredoxin family protein [Clostridia bacterium]|nr:thioredoxin family protein [Clostridia bacterium]
MTAMKLTAKDFDAQVSRGNGEALVEFWAPWCVHCKRIAPAMDKVTQEYADKLTIGRVNIDEEPELARRFGVEVIPTLMMIRGGQADGVLVAPDSKAKIDAFIAQKGIQ